MCDKELILDVLDNIEQTLNEVVEWTEDVVSVDDFLMSHSGMILLNAVCMKLLAIGEEVKSLDKRTDKTLLSRYPQIQWKDVMGMRDIIAHHYFELEADKVFDALQNDIKPLLQTIKQIKKDFIK